MPGKPKNQGKEWTPQDIKKLRDLARAETSTPQIARELGRTKNAIYSEASDKHISLKPKDKPHH